MDVLLSQYQQLQPGVPPYMTGAAYGGMAAAGVGKNCCITGAAYGITGAVNCCITGAAYGMMGAENCCVMGAAYITDMAACCRANASRAAVVHGTP